MKIRNAASCLMLFAVLLASIQVDVTYSLTIKGEDTSLRNSPTYVEFHDGTSIRVPNGETVTIPGDVTCMVVRRAEMGWYPPVPMDQSALLSFRSTNTRQ